MKNIKVLLLLLVISLVCLPIGNNLVNASGMESTQIELAQTEKLICSATLEDNFTDDCVLVVLTNPASLANMNYSPDDFSEIDCKSVRNLTQSRTNQVATILTDSSVNTTHSDSSKSISVSGSTTIDLESFNQILSLELKETGKDKVLEAIRILEQRTDVLSAGPNYIYSEDTSYLSSDTASYYISRSHLQTNASRSVTTNDTYAEDQWALDMINLPSAWQITTGSSNSVTVGIIDKGIDAGHPDLSGKVDVSNSRIFDADGNVITASTILDPIGHGTMIAGIIGATTNNSRGISGTNWNVQLASLSTQDPSGNSATTDSYVAAFEFATDKNIRILSMSISLEEPDLTLYFAIEDYLESGLLVCSGGNRTQNEVETNEPQIPRYPAFCELDNIISVGAATQYDLPWYRSYCDSKAIDLFAPGAPVYSTMSRSVCSTTDCGAFGYHVAYNYHADSGTSYAAPYVAGVASLLLSLDDDLNNTQLRYHIMNGVDVKSAYQGKCQTGGRLNAYKVLSGHVCYYTDDGGSGHYRYCVCGLNVFEDHTFTDIGGLLVCSGCGFAF